MNKKDCEAIGYLLSISMSPEEIHERLFELDSRIEPEYIGFEEVQGRSESVDELAEKLMCERNKFSLHWSLIKKENLKCTYAQCLEDARREIYGENYNPAFFDRSYKG